jgi:hypothetical protein
MEQELVAEAQAVRKCIAKVVEAREAHGLVVGQRDASVRELNELTTARAAVEAQLATREKETALAGGELPDEPFPEEAEVSRLSRHVRIRRESVRICENKVRECQEGLDSQVRVLEQAWAALGSATSDLLLKEFREAATAMRDAQLRYLALSPHFYRTWSSSVWKHFDNRLAVADPMSAELILDPIRGTIASRWPLSAQTILGATNDLRAEIDAATGRRGAAPILGGGEHTQATADEGE